ncbi:MAG: hypothetical protein NVS1B12_06210 [Acidimicrobiales bacterium]
MRRHRLAVVAGAAFLVLAGAELAGGLRGADADPSPGSAFGAYSISATAHGLQVSEDRLAAAAHPESEGEIPESIAQLQTGPQGYALSSVAWPGPLVANAGSTAQLLNLGLPSSTTDTLNEPVRAEARTGSGPPTVTNTTYPGTMMRASAVGDDVEADTTTAGTAGPAPQTRTGNTETSSSSRLTSPSGAVAVAKSTVQRVSLAGGVVTFGSVTSSATASTDGHRAIASGGTTVFDLRVGGQPAYLDESGLHLGTSGPGVPVNAIAAQLAQEALGGAGMKVVVSQPTTHAGGSSITYDAGNVVFYWSPPNSQGETFTATFGGASVAVAAFPGFGTGTPTDTATPPTGGDSSSAAGPPGAAVSERGGVALATAPRPVSGRTGPAPNPSVSLTPTRASTPLRLPRGLAPAFPMLVLLGSALIGFGLRTLPDRALEASTTSCPLGGQP